MSAVAVIGSRSFHNYKYVKERLDQLEITRIVSGGAIGVDTLADKYATEMNIPIKHYYPDYDEFGKSAPLRRNEDIIKDAEIVVAFWDGTSKGTKNALSIAKNFSKKVRVFYIDSEMMFE